MAFVSVASDSALSLCTFVLGCASIHSPWVYDNALCREALAWTLVPSRLTAPMRERGIARATAATPDGRHRCRDPRGRAQAPKDRGPRPHRPRAAQMRFRQLDLHRQWQQLAGVAIDRTESARARRPCVGRFDSGRGRVGPTGSCAGAPFHRRRCQMLGASNPSANIGLLHSCTCRGLTSTKNSLPSGICTTFCCRIAQRPTSGR